MAHYCHWPGCPCEVPPKLWGCRPHWYLLPKNLRDWIWATYRTGQEITKDPSVEYIEAARAVQDWIREHGTEARDKIMPKKRTSGPTLFGDVDAGPTNGAYGPPPAVLTTDHADDTDKKVSSDGPSDSSVVSVKSVVKTEPPPHVREKMREIASEVVREVASEYSLADARRIAELEDAVRRAIGWIKGEYFETARTVLEGVFILEPTHAPDP